MPARYTQMYDKDKKVPKFPRTREQFVFDVNKVRLDKILYVLATLTNRQKGSNIPTVDPSQNHMDGGYMSKSTDGIDIEFPITGMSLVLRGTSTETIDSYINRIYAALNVPRPTNM